MSMHKTAVVAAFLVLLLAGTDSYGPALSGSARPQKSVEREVTLRLKDKKHSVARQVRAVLWEEPQNIERLDLFYGPGGREGAPDPSDRFTFIRRIKKGYSRKIVVTDEQGRQWVVKFGIEARPETAATRIVNAMGYYTDTTYFVRRARIYDQRKSFDAVNVRFERRFADEKETGHWSWTDNPFKGTREMDGLKVLMALLNNWDLKESNNDILCREGNEGRMRCWYYVSDLGATFGKTGSFARTMLPFIPNVTAGTRGQPKDYVRQRFIDDIRRGQVVFHYKGNHRSALKGIRVEHALWMGEMLGRLSDRQLSDAFRAAGYNETETEMYVRALRSRIRQLQDLEPDTARLR
ncbi:MAG TPA: hypothetical protein VNQ79_12255 [Blastocatellia bacterium]|nr:hypothetical protein [Blastocatellia bacterium]